MKRMRPTKVVIKSICSKLEIPFGHIKLIFCEVSSNKNTVEPDSLCMERNHSAESLFCVPDGNFVVALFKGDLCDISQSNEVVLSRQKDIHRSFHLSTSQCFLHFLLVVEFAYSLDSFFVRSISEAVAFGSRYYFDHLISILRMSEWSLMLPKLPEKLSVLGCKISLILKRALVNRFLVLTFTPHVLVDLKAKQILHSVE